MREKVVGLRGEAALAPGQRDEAIARMLSDLTIRNNRGELAAVLCAFVNSNSEGASTWAGDRPYSRATAIGALEVLKMRFWTETPLGDSLPFIQTDT